MSSKKKLNYLIIAVAIAVAAVAIAYYEAGM